MNIYTCHRYRGVLLQRLMAAEATPTQSLEDTWVEVSTSCVHELCARAVTQAASQDRL